MSESIEITAPCGIKLKGKLWKQGGSIKCPEYWSFVTYPKPEYFDLYRDMRSLCEGCEKLEAEG